MIPHLDDWLIHHPDHKVLLRHQAQLINTLDLVGFVLNRKKSELDLSQDIQFTSGYPFTSGLRGSFPSRVQSLGDSCTRTPSILPPCTNLQYTEVSQLMGSLNWASGLIPLGRLYLRPLQRHFHTFQADFTIFTDASTQGWGAHMGDSQISGIWTLTDRKLHINCLELKAVV